MSDTTEAPKPSPLSARELKFSREVPVSPERLFHTWHSRMTEHFTPAPWKTVEVELDLRPGGIFRSVMQSPEGQQFPNVGVFLEVIENRKIVFTDAYKPGWEPNPELFFTGMLEFELLPNGGTRYTATARHWSEEKCENHKAMGFFEGWGVAFDQLVAIAQQD